MWWSIIAGLCIVCISILILSRFQNNISFKWTESKKKAIAVNSADTADNPSLSTIVTTSWGILVQERKFICEKIVNLYSSEIYF